MQAKSATRESSSTKKVSFSLARSRQPTPRACECGAGLLPTKRAQPPFQGRPPPPPNRMVGWPSGRGPIRQRRKRERLACLVTSGRARSNQETRAKRAKRRCSRPSSVESVGRRRRSRQQRRVRKLGEERGGSAWGRDFICARLTREKPREPRGTCLGAAGILPANGRYGR